MTMPNISKIDRPKIEQLALQPPQSLLLAGEPGIDIEAVSSLIANHTPSDISLLTPLDNKSYIGVPQVRDAINAMRTYATKRRVLIIRRGDQLTEEAQNALLKILEEPNNQLYFIIETFSVDSLLPTLKSRCQTVQLHRTSPPEDAKILESFAIDNQKKQQILFLASGRPRLLLDLANDDTMFSKYKQMATDAKTVIAKPDSYKSLKILLDYSKDREVALSFVDVLLSLVKFQIKNNPPTTKIQLLLDNIYRTEACLQSNGHVKLSLLGLVL